MTAPDTITLFVLAPVLIPVDDNNPGGAFGEVLKVNGVIIGGPGELPAVGGGPVTGATERIKINNKNNTYMVQSLNNAIFGVKFPL